MASSLCLETPDDWVRLLKDLSIPEARSYWSEFELNASLIKAMNGSVPNPHWVNCSGAVYSFRKAIDELGKLASGGYFIRDPNRGLYLRLLDSHDKVVGSVVMGSNQAALSRLENGWLVSEVRERICSNYRLLWEA